MDPFRNPPADSLAAARLHVQALTECGLPREALLRALLENYQNPGPGERDGGFPQQHQQELQQQQQQQHKTRLSVSTTSSRSSGRASSILSTASSMSSVSCGAPAGRQLEGSAPPLPTLPTLSSASSAALPPPAAPAKSSNRGASKAPGVYWCTFCDVAFQRKFDWKRHEDEFHERYKRYPCPNCNRIFWGANTFNQHHKNAHGCTTCPHAERVVRYTRRRQAWACGFCGGFLAGRDRYFDHVARHYEDGCNKAHWNHSLVIYGLLHQPAIDPAWKELDAALYGHLSRSQQPMFEWDPARTGHAQGFLEGESPGQLQDLLEFFNDAEEDARLLARLAHDQATIRFRHEMNSAPTPPSRRVSEPPQKTTTEPKKLLSSSKHMSAPQQSQSDLSSILARQQQQQQQQHQQYESCPNPYVQKRQRSIIPSSTPAPLSATSYHHQHQPPQTILEAPETTHFFDLAVPNLSGNLFEDWSSLTATVVDETAVFTTLSDGWAEGELRSPYPGGD